MNTRIFALLGSIFAAELFLVVPRAIALSSDSEAQSGALEEIVVTAQRREERQLDVPISITALSQQQLTTANVQSLGDIAKLTPSLRFDNESAFFQPSIRGIGTAVTTSGGGSNVGVYIDGFYSPNPLAADFQLTDVTSIQVLKGPQGTLFGHNSTGGAILVTTADPSKEQHAEARVDYGEFNAQRYQGYATTGLGDNVAMDLEGIYTKGNGFLTNILDNNSDVGAYESWTVRTGLKVDVSEKVSVLVRYTHSRENDPAAQMTNSNTDTTIDPTTGKPWGIQTFAVPGFYTTNPDQVAANVPRFFISNNDVGQMTIKADLGFANLTSLSQYRQESADQSEDLDQTGLPIFSLGLPIYDKTWTQEFLLNSKPGPALQWTAGAYYFSALDRWTTYIDNFVESTGRVLLGGSGTTTQNYAAYLDGTYQLTPQLFLTVGARYSHDIVDNAYWNTAFTAIKNYVPSINSNKVTPRAVLRYKPSDESAVYASYTEGYKARIIDVGGSCQDGPAFQCNPVEPEDVHAFEVGYKFDNRRLANDISAFYYDYKNLQVSEFLGAAQAFIVNAADSHIYGLDESFHFNVDEHFQVNAGAAWTHARYVTFGTTVNGKLFGAPIYASCPADPSSLPPQYVAACGPGNFTYVNQETVLHDATMQHTPEFTATLGARATTGMTPSGEYVLSGNFYYSSKFYFSPSGTQFLQPDYETLDLRGQWTHPSKKFFAAVYGNNVTNERYRTQVQYNSFGIGASWSAPATWGVEIGAKY